MKVIATFIDATGRVDSHTHDVGPEYSAVWMVATFALQDMVPSPPESVKADCMQRPDV